MAAAAVAAAAAGGCCCCLCWPFDLLAAETPAETPAAAAAQKPVILDAPPCMSRGRRINKMYL